MESFYGGRRGASFVLVRSFSTVQEMINNFKKGLEYREVDYDEYVLINTVSRNNLDNGKIYRRGRDYSNSLGGAEYIGTIVGPGGKSPMLSLTTINDVKNKYQTANRDEVNSFTEGSYIPSNGLVPGKTSSGQYNDSIKWASCSISLPNGESVEAYIGFEIPYLVVDYSADSVDPYYHRSNATENFTNQQLVDRIDDKTHPFYANWNIKIPKGIKGDTFKNFRVITASNSIQDYTGKADDVTNQRKILVYDYYHYDKNSSGEPVSVYLGDYNMISGMTFNEDGTVSIDYTHDNTVSYNKLVKWIKNVSLNKNTGHFEIEFNFDEKDGEPTIYETDLSWVKNINVTEDGIIKLEFSTGEIENLDNKIKWIKDVTLSADGSFTVTYNDDTVKSFSKEIKWIDNISLTDKGVFTVHYNNGTPDYITNLKWVRDVELEENGDVTFVYNDDTTKAYEKFLKIIDNVTLTEKGLFTVHFNNGSPDYTTNLKWVRDITLDENGDINVNYNDDTNTAYEGYLKTIKEVTLSDKGVFTVKYNNGEPDYTTNLKWVKDVEVTEKGDITFSYNDDTTNAYEKYLKIIKEVSLSDEGLFTVSFNNESPDYTTKLKWTKDIELRDNGDIEFIYNDNTSALHEKYVKTIKDVSIETSDESGEEGTGSQKVLIEYNTGDTELIGNPLNYIIETAFTPDYHFIVYYSDPLLRAKIVEEGLAYPKEYKGKNDWLDLGSIKDEDGILIGLNILRSDLGDLRADEYLNQNYPEGLTGELKGKIVTVGNLEDTKVFYAFNYGLDENENYLGWYRLGEISIDVSQLFMIEREDDPNIDSKKEQLNTGGIWFVAED
ncbi:MAG: putative outer membrane protein [Caudoviricetes sp.]|nr:MAG: putative outer membrane protein [Caudoviricetes sp.]